jgi:HEPN/RES N-terminal domain 1
MQHRHRDEFVCDKCIDDIGIASFIKQNAESKTCSFCNRRSPRPIAAPLADVIEYIESCVSGPYEDPANSMAFESAEGGYQGTTYSTDELLSEVIELEFPNDHSGKLFEAICDGFETEIWCETDPYGMSPHQQLSFSWEEFCRTIRHNGGISFSTRAPSTASF